MASSVPSTSRSASPYHSNVPAHSMAASVQLPPSSSVAAVGSNAAATTSSPAGNVASSQPTASLPMTTMNQVAEYASSMADHLYNAFIHAEYTDLTLHVNYQDEALPSAVFGIHGVIVSRSPYLKSLAYNGSTHLSLQAPAHCTHSALNVVLLSLYTPAAHAHITPELGPGVLAAASLLQLPDLAVHAEKACASDVMKASTPEDFSKWFSILGSSSSSNASVESSPSMVNGGHATNGTAGSVDRSSTSSSSFVEQAHGRLRDLLYERLVVQLPNELGAFDPKGKQGEREAQQKLLQVLATLPFDVFKRVIESPKLPIARSADLDRFNFAKRVVAERKRLHQTRKAASQQAQDQAAGSASPRSTAGPALGDFDETVVLQFGDPSSSGGTAVSVLRKQRKREYWKVGASMQ